MLTYLKFNGSKKTKSSFLFIILSMPAVMTEGTSLFGIKCSNVQVFKYLSKTCHTTSTSIRATFLEYEKLRRSVSLDEW